MYNIFRLICFYEFKFSFRIWICAFIRNLGDHHFDLAVLWSGVIIAVTLGIGKGDCGFLVAPTPSCLHFSHCAMRLSFTKCGLIFDQIDVFTVFFVKYDNDSKRS